MKQVREARHNLEDSVRNLTSALLSYYFPPTDNWLIGSEQDIGAGQVDFSIFKVKDIGEELTPSEAGDIQDHSILECKKRGESLKNTIEQLSLYTEGLVTSNRCFVIIMIGTKIGFYQYYDPYFSLLSIIAT